MERQRQVSEWIIRNARAWVRASRLGHPEPERHLRVLASYYLGLYWGVCARDFVVVGLLGELGAIDVVSVRLWLDRTIAVADPANVFSRFDALQGAGATFFMLDQLQNDDPQLLWGEEAPQGSVVAALSPRPLPLARLHSGGAYLPASSEARSAPRARSALPPSRPVRLPGHPN